MIENSERRNNHTHSFIELCPFTLSPGVDYSVNTKEAKRDWTRIQGERNEKSFALPVKIDRQADVSRLAIFTQELNDTSLSLSIFHSPGPQ